MVKVIFYFICTETEKKKQKKCGERMEGEYLGAPCKPSNDDNEAFKKTVWREQ